MSAFTRALGLQPGDTAALVGCGGKTSLLLRLAAERRAGRAMIATTTRIFPPPPGSFDREVTPEADSFAAEPGVTLVHGGQNADGKLLPWPRGDFEALCHRFDYAFLECDGSKALPLKGWADHEPVVPGFADATIGVCTLSALGKPVDEYTVHRPELFCRLTGARPDQPVELAHIATMIANRDGMFRRAAGRRVLFINQVESAEQLALARQLLAMLPPEFRRGLAICCAGSVLHGEIETLQQGESL